MKTIYVCTSYMKTRQKDHYETGCDYNTTEHCGGGQLRVSADTLPQLLEYLAEVCEIRGEKIDDVWLPGEGSKRLCWNRQETARGTQPSPATMEKFERGEVVLYLADYDFIVEKRVVSAIDEAELTAAGIKFHD